MDHNNNLLSDLPSSINQLRTLIHDRNVTTNDFLEFERMASTTRRLTRQDTKWTGEIDFLLWNATGLMANLDRIVKRLEDENIMFCFVTETWLNPKYSIPSVCRDTSAVCSIFPHGYERGKNGVSMIINPKFARHPVMKDMEVLCRDTLNGTYLYVQLGTVNVLCVYFPPSCPTDLNIWMEEIFLACKINSQNDLLVLGDFNARLREWGDHEGNTRGRQLKEFVEANGLTRFDTGGQPTFIKSTTRPQDGCSIVDHLFGNFEIIETRVTEPFNSAAGHRPIYGKIRISADTMNAPPSYKRLRLEKIREEGVKERLHSKIENISESLVSTLRDSNSQRPWFTLPMGQAQQNIDSFEKTMNSKILDAAKSVLGEKDAGKKVIKHEYLKSDALDALELAILWETNEEELKRLLKDSEAEKKKLRKEKFDQFANSVGESPANDMMKIVSSMLRNRRKQQLALNSSPASLAEYRDHFESMNKNNLPHHASNVEPRILNNVELPVECIMATHLRPYVVRDIIKRTAWNKSPGLSGITYDILKCGGENLWKLISEFFIAIVKAKRVPASWKRALVVPVPKKGDLCKIQNYRPISLTEPLRKIFEHCMLLYVNESAGSAFLTQGGFRTNHCCNDMVVTLHDALRSLKGKGHVAFLDIKAAYDSVDRRILWRRCLNRGIHSDAVDILKELFDSNSSQVVVNGRKSLPFHIEAGVLQGSVLSPCLYSIFIDDLAKELSLSHKITVGEASINCTLYADDIALIADEHWKLQELLDICTAHSEKNRYRFSAPKCEMISDEHNVLMINGAEIPRTNSFKYLGVEITRKGIDHKTFLNRRTTEAIRSAEKLAGMGMNLGGLPLSTSAIIYKVFIRPKLEASVCILPPLKLIFKKLEQAQCLILRRILRTGPTASSTICRSLLQVPRMYHRVKWLRTRFIRRYDNVLGEGHVLKLVSAPHTSWIEKKLRVDLYPDDVEGQEAWYDEMTEVHNETKDVTSGSLQFNVSKKLINFLKPNIPAFILRPVLSWILKRYPGRDPPRCSSCLIHKATQEHIANCNTLLNDHFADVPFRFRPEQAVSNLSDSNILTNLFQISLSIAKAVNRSIPDFHFEILSDSRSLI